MAIGVHGGRGEIQGEAATEAAIPVLENEETGDSHR